MPDDLLDPRLGIGGNAPPLAERLADETAPLLARAKELAASAGRAAVTDEETAGKATLLAKMIKEHVAKIEAEREQVKKPYLEAGRTVDAHYKGIASTLADPLKSIIGMVDAYRREQEAKAAAERRRLEEEARKQREAAEAAARAQREAEEREQRAAEEAARKVREAEEAAQRAANREAAAEAARKAAEARAEQEKAERQAAQRRLEAELEERAHRERAEALGRQAATAKAGPIDSGYGTKAHARKVYRAEITDMTAAIRHARKVDESAVRAAVQAIYDRQVKAGVRELPGAVVHEETTTVIR